LDPSKVTKKMKCC